MKRLICLILCMVFCIFSFKAITDSEESWTCPNCGKTNTKLFCGDCGMKKPEQTWLCICGNENTTRFCENCGRPKEEGTITLSPKPSDTSTRKPTATPKPAQKKSTKKTTTLTPSIRATRSRADQLKKVTHTPNPTPTPKRKVASATTKPITKIRINKGSTPNVRSKPSTKGKIVGHANSGQVYEVLSTSGTWYKIELTDGTKGWIASGMVTIIGISDATPKRTAKATPEPTKKKTSKNTATPKRTVKATPKPTASAFTIYNTERLTSVDVSARQWTKSTQYASLFAVLAIEDFIFDSDISYNSTSDFDLSCGAIVSSDAFTISAIFALNNGKVVNLTYTPLTKSGEYNYLYNIKIASFSDMKMLYSKIKSKDAVVASYLLKHGDLNEAFALMFEALTQR